MTSSAGAIIGAVGWSEVAPDVLVRRYLPVDTTISVVRGGDGLLLVDTGGSPAEAAQIEGDLRELGGRLRWVVNTHAHFDHTFGNQQFGPGSAADVPIYGHHLLPAHLEEHERPRLAAWIAGTGSEPPRDWGDVVITPPIRLVRERSWLDLGDRAVELVPLGPGHTDGDLVVHVPARPDAVPDMARDAWIVGDVLEQPGPPMYGSGCFPLTWPSSLAELLEEVGSEDVILPGHGRPVSREFGLAQLAVLRSTADLIRHHHAAGHSAEQALSSPDGWTYPSDALTLAVWRGYAESDSA